MNINQQVISYVLQNASVIILFVMPMITMRTYSEEKRSGTIELLLTSPVTDVEIIVGKFLGALGLYVAMLLVTVRLHRHPVRLRQPRVAAAGGGYLGLLLMGGAFISLGLLISSTTNNQIVAGIITFVVFLMLWIVGWFADSSGPMIGDDHRVPVDHRALRRLLEGHHRHEARHLLPELHHFRPLPDGQVRRLGKVERLDAMLKRILGLLGWLGVALVFAAVAIKFSKPEWQQYYFGLAIAGLVCTLLYILSQWREIGQAFAGRQARLGSLAVGQRLRRPRAFSSRINYLGTRHNKRWDLTAAKQFSLSDQTRKVLQDLKQPVHIRVFARSDDFERFRDRLDEYTYASKQVSVEYLDPEKKPALAQQYGITALGTVVFEYAGRNEKATSDGEQELTNALIKVVQGRQPKVYFVQGHGEKDTTSADRTGYNSITSALTSDNFLVDKVVLAQQTAVPADADVLVVAGPRTDFLAPEIDMVKAYLAQGREAAAPDRSGVEGRSAAADGARGAC